jgi:hypothetical protein
MHKTLRHAGVQSLLEPTDGVCVDSEDILELLSEVGIRPDDVSLARDVLKLPQSALGYSSSHPSLTCCWLKIPTSTVVASLQSVQAHRDGVIYRHSVLGDGDGPLETRVVKVYPRHDKMG